MLTYCILPLITPPPPPQLYGDVCQLLRFSLGPVVHEVGSTMYKIEIPPTGILNFFLIKFGEFGTMSR